MSEIWLIRHAESEANAGERTTDPAQIRLTKRGQEQAACLANAFPRQPQLVVTSPYIRTKQTAIPLLERFHNIEQQEWEIQEFTFLSPVTCQNMTKQERSPLVADYWTTNDPLLCDGIGAESFADFMDRVDQFIGQIKSLENEFTAVFSHGQFIRAVLWRLMSEEKDISQLRMKQFRDFMVSFAIFNAATIKIRTGKDSSFWISPVESRYIPSELST